MKRRLRVQKILVLLLTVAMLLGDTLPHAAASGLNSISSGDALETTISGNDSVSGNESVDGDEAATEDAAAEEIVNSEIADDEAGDADGAFVGAAFSVSTLLETADDDTLTAALSEAKTFIDALTVNNSSNDPGSVVSTWGSEFTWDNEKRESNNKSYLFEWSYYNGVVFEGLDYVYDVTGEGTYADYVTEYLSTMITSSGGWATCTGSSKQCAGYNSLHGADCYKTASLLLDYYKITGDSRYLTMAKSLYTDLQNAQSSYVSSDRGGNYNHTWSSTPTYAVWLDGLYMIQPFMAEYAAYTNDTEEMDRIAARFAWIGENMYNSSTGLYYHAANSSTSYYNNNGSYWGRAIGWYAAAMVDVMDYMTGDNLTAMKTQLKKLVDGMLPYQAEDGMWRQFVNVSSSTEETSVTALMTYAIMKAVNNGWLDSAYAEYAVNAFEGMCDYALDASGLHYICFKGSTSGYSDPAYSSYVNEGKGVGPFIMAYAEVLEYTHSSDEDEDKEEESTEPQTVIVGDTSITVSNISGTLTGSSVTEEDAALIEAEGYEKYIAYDLSATLAEGEKAIVSIPVPSEWNVTSEDAERLVGLSVEDGVLKELNGTLTENVFSFEVEHFSAKGVALAAEEEETVVTGSVTGTGNLVGDRVYELDTDGLDAVSPYLIASAGSGSSSLLTRNGSSTSSTTVTVSDSKIIVSDDTNLAWTISGTSNATVSNGGYKVALSNNSLSLTTGNNNTSLSVSDQENGEYWIYRSGRNTYYLKYDSGWTCKTSSASVYLFKYTSTSNGEEVVFTITPGSTTLLPEGNITLNTTVTVAGEVVDLSDCTVAWESSNTSYVTVTDGVVTGVADGVANITATLSEVNGTALQENIVLTIPVTVASKKVTSATLTGNDPVTTKQNVEPDFSNIKLKVTYEDDTAGVITVDNGLVIEGYDITKIGYAYATISYNGVQYGTVRVTVEGNPYEGLEDATEYPEYPADGAVRIDKTATQNATTFKNTGVTHVELNVAGISVKPAVDVILVTDLSNSMAWEVGTRTDATSHDTTKLASLKKSVESFADIFLAADEDGNATENTMSLVTFGGYDADHTNKEYTDYADSTQTLMLGSNDATTVKSTINNIMLLADDALSIGTSTTGYYLSFDGGNTYGENYGNTNYDHAFMQTADAIKGLKSAYEETTGISYDESGRQIYILFMTDGAPSNYDGVYYNYKTGDRADVNCTWINASGSETTYTMGINNKQYDADAWYQYIAGGTYNASTGTITGNPLYWADQIYNTEGVADIYNIGFDLDNGGFSSMTFTEEDGRPLEKVLEKLVTGQTLEVYSADDEEGLSAIYADLATKIRYAGTSANVTDVVDSEFTLQMAATSGSDGKTAKLSDFGITPSINITAYDLYTKEETSDTTKIGTRKGTSTVLETVTFNESGTEAYSNMIGEGETNILSTAADGTVTITGFYFTYTKTPEGVETFKWAIGNITEKEVVLSYDVYLKDSLEGGCPEGIYYTNESAVLEYVDINGDYAKQTFPVPSVGWGGASTTIRFYLVNEKGEPVNRNGEVVPMANCIYVGEPVTVRLNLNADATIDAQTVEAAAYVPSEYYLYDINAYYTVQTASGTDNTIIGGITVSDPSDDASKTTGGKTQTGAQTTIVIDHEQTYYTWSLVGFGVRYDLITEETEDPLVKDQIVIDYGKAIQVDVLANDPDVSGYERLLTGFVVFNANTDTSIKQLNAGAATYTAANGSFSIVDQKVQFQLNKMLSEVQQVFYVVKYTSSSNEEDYYYLFGELDVIPATSVYYETDFANGVFTVVENTTNENAGWNLTKTVTDDAVADGPQDDGTIGINQTYGYDSTYENDAYLSNGSSYFVAGQGYANTYATFSFTGTGFDLISRTGVNQGLIKVQIFSDAAMTTENLVKTVTVLNKSEAEGSLELYQIPVVSVNTLAYGTYYVKVSVNTAYTNEAYPTLNRGNEFYFDAIRIFDPAYGNAVAEAAYAADGEANRQQDEVRALLITADDFDALSSTDSTATFTEGIVFVDRPKAESGIEDNNVVQVSTYAAIGPNNEVYLEKGQAIAFKITANSVPASIDIGAKSITGGAAMLSAVVTDSATETYTVTKEIASSTAQNINLMNDATATAMADGEAYVIITNTGVGVLSITDIKVAYNDGTAAASEEYGISTVSLEDEAENGTEAYDAYAVAYTVDAATFSVARTVLTASEDVEETPEESEPEEEPVYDILSAVIDKNGDKKQKKTVIIVETTQDVVELKITEGRKTARYSSMEYEDQEDGTRVWTIVLTNNGNKTYTITGYGEDGSCGASVSVSNRKNKH